MAPHDPESAGWELEPGAGWYDETGELVEAAPAFDPQRFGEVYRARLRYLVQSPARGEIETAWYARWAREDVEVRGRDLVAEWGERRFEWEDVGERGLDLEHYLRAETLRADYAAGRLPADPVDVAQVQAWARDDLNVLAHGERDDVERAVLTARVDLVRQEYGELPVPEVSRAEFDAAFGENLRREREHAEMSQSMERWTAQGLELAADQALRAAAPEGVDQTAGVDVEADLVRGLDDELFVSGYQTAAAAWETHQAEYGAWQEVYGEILVANAAQSRHGLNVSMYELDGDARAARMDAALDRPAVEVEPPAAGGVLVELGETLDDLAAALDELGAETVVNNAELVLDDVQEPGLDLAADVEAGPELGIELDDPPGE